MDPLEMVDALARRARAEIAPETNARIAAVLAAGQRRQQSAREGFLAPFAWSAGLSALAACVVLCLALHANKSTKTDSIEPLFQAAEVQLP
ncbi:MAG TPA: hypothetical protein VGG44_03530 [Tepidisphaeraceae bacterium]|jgi:hypothetical protein